jgi:hypothetical protein
MTISFGWFKRVTGRSRAADTIRASPAAPVLAEGRSDRHPSTDEYADRM